MKYLFYIIGFILILNMGKIIRFSKKLCRFIYWKYIDFRRNMENKRKGIEIFRPFGLTLFCGRQGSGKTMSLVYYCWNLKKKYPRCKIYSNFGLSFADGHISSLNDLLQIRNGEDGVIFAFDEIQNEFSSASSKNFPETLLSTITMQRKQKIHIVATSQVYTRVAKPIREQCFEVVECRTFGGRWTRNRAYDAADYNMIVDSTDPDKKFKLHKVWKDSFIQTDSIRESYNTYEVIQRLSRQGFVQKFES